MPVGGSEVSLPAGLEHSVAASLAPLPTTAASVSSADREDSVRVYVVLSF